MDQTASIREVLNRARTIAVVGLSSNPAKDSHSVAAYLQAVGYRIIPVNPSAREVLGSFAYPDLLSVPETIDVVLIFRPGEEVPAVVDQAIQVRARAVWMQLGIIHPAAAAKARASGLTVIMDACMRTEHRALAATGPTR